MSAISKIAKAFKLNLFQAYVPFPYPLKTSENLYFYHVSRGYKNETLAWNGLNDKLKSNYLVTVRQIPTLRYLSNDPFAMSSNMRIDGVAKIHDAREM